MDYLFSLLVVDPTGLLLQDSSDDLVQFLRDWIAPVFLLLVGIVALTFLWRRQMMEFLQFFALAIGIAVFFYFPEFLETIAEAVANTLGL